MNYASTQKFVRMSPRKLRLITQMVKNMRPADAIEDLTFVNKRAALPVQKVIKSAVANAVAKGANPESLKFESIQVNEGMRLKRFRPVSRGRAHSYVRQLSHIKVVLSDEGTAKTAKKQVKKEEPKEEKKVKKNSSKKVKK